MTFALNRTSIAFAALMALCGATSSYAEEDLRQAAQNPVADLISVPIQNNTNFNVGLLDKTQNITNIQPVVPFSLNSEWNLITRTILPVIYQPPFFAGDDTDFGIGDLNPSFFFSPKAPTPIAPGVGLVWGVGPALSLPTATDDRLGSEKWSAGPSLVALLLTKQVVTGFLVNNLWSFAGDDNRADVNAMTLQPFFNYNLPEGWYLTTSPIITANWEADSENRWTIPVGGGIGRLFKIGHQPVNAQISAYYNVETPEDTGADWQLRTQLQFLFPSK
jgi:hypothetical protein